MGLIETIQPLVTLLFSFFTFIGIVIAVYKFSYDPDEKANERINKIETVCEYKHEAIDKMFASIASDFRFLKENHIKHIESNIKSIDRRQIEILAILREKYKIEIDK